MQHNDSLVGWLCGIGGGFAKMYLLQIGNDSSFLVKLFEAGITALICGILGAAGKHLYDKYVIKNKK